MSSTNLFRWGGIAAILAGVLYPTSWIFKFVIGADYILTTSIGFIAMVLLIFGLIAIYGIQVEESGIYGLLGFILTIISTCMDLGQCWLPESGEITGVAGVLGPLIGITALPGYILLGIGSWKANIFPRWITIIWPSGWVISMISMVVFMSGVEIAYNLAGIGLAIWGIGLIGAGVKLFGGIERSTS